MIDGAATLPARRGSIEEKGSLADFIWFRTGGPAEWLVRPRDVDDLAAFLGDLDPSVPVLPVGVGSNLIVRDGGVPGVVVRLPKSMARVSIEPGTRVREGARSEEHTSELQSLMRISYAVFCLKKKKPKTK